MGGMEMDQYFRAAGFGDDRANNKYYDLRKRYGKLYYHFKPDHTYWILAIIGRKAAIAVSALLLRTNATFQVAVIVLILFIAFVLQLIHRPYLSSGERVQIINELEDKAELAIDRPEFKKYKTIREQITIASKRFHKEKREQKRRNYSTVQGFWGGKTMDEKKVKIRDRGHSKGRERLEVEVGKEYYVFNFNSVELVLLMCSIIISLAGLMLSSGRFDERPDLVAQRDFITYIAIIVLVFSILYYLLVFMAEFSPVAVGYFVKRFFTSEDAPDESKKVRTKSIALQNNPMFEVNEKFEEFGDNTKTLEKDIVLTSKELKKIAKENEKLRSELRKKKIQEAERRLQSDSMHSYDIGMESVNPMFDPDA